MLGRNSLKLVATVTLACRRRSHLIVGGGLVLVLAVSLLALMAGSAPAFAPDDFSQSVTGSIPATIDINPYQLSQVPPYPSVTTFYYATINLRGASGPTCPASQPHVVGTLQHGLVGSAVHATYLEQFDHSPACNLYEVPLYEPGTPLSPNYTGPDTFHVFVNGTFVPSATVNFNWIDSDPANP
jgi:hypothetical protein